MKYKVMLTRDASESVEVEVEADSPEEADDAAMALAGPYGESVSGWELDDNTRDVYLPSPGSAEEVSEEGD